MNQKLESLIKVTKPNLDVGANTDKLDDSQTAAVMSHADRIVLRASPGSGKTWSIINAVAQYRYENLNDRICAITYTRAARAEMEARLQELGVYDVEVTTIHVWARTLLYDFSVKYDFKIRILEEPMIKEILHTIIEAYTKISKVKSINEDIVYSFVMGNKNMEISDKYRNTLAAIDRRYIAYKRAKVLYDFTDYPLYLYDILCTYNETIKNIDALFVDEFQDVDETQYSVFQRVECKKFFAVGDPWQSIYLFRGADGAVFRKMHDNSQLYKLKYNYRSYQEIIDYANTVYTVILDQLKNEMTDLVISNIVEKEPSGIKCVRGEGGYIYVSDRYGRHLELHKDKVSRVDRDYVFSTMLARKPMILCRTNKQVAALNSMGYFDCSTVHQAKGLEYDNVIVVDNVIKDEESLNVAYVALTRAKNRVWVIGWGDLSGWIGKYIK